MANASIISRGLAVRLPSPAPSLGDLISSADLNVVLPRVFAAGVGSMVGGEYVHWDDIRNRSAPAGLDARSWWLGIALSRLPMFRSLPLVAVDGVPFRYALPDEALELTRRAGEQFLTSGLIEEGQRALGSVLGMVGMKVAATPRRALCSSASPAWWPPKAERCASWCPTSRRQRAFSST